VLVITTSKIHSIFLQINKVINVAQHGPSIV